jgi:trk system potassium uptake protein
VKFREKYAPEGGKKMTMIRKKGLHPPKILALSLFAIILIGTVLLKCPFSTKEPVSWFTAFFTATSATTISGFTTAFNGDAFTPIGNIIIIILVQLGGLGIMTFAVVIFVVLDRPISISQRLMIQEALNQSSLSGITKLAKRLFFFSLFFEGFIAILLAIRFVPEFGWKHGLIHAAFLSVSAFNNSGFALWPDSLAHFVGDPTVNILVTALIIVGGIGFTVMIDIWDKKKWRAFSLHTKMMLLGTLVLNVIAVLVFLAIEFNNPQTLGPLHHSDKIWAAYFQGISARTSGFSTIDMSLLEPSTKFFIMILMFIGAGSVSTGGGIKVTTLVCLLSMVVAYIRKTREPVFMKRSIHRSDIFKALAITTLAVSVIFSAVFILLLIEKPTFSFLDIAFEVVSAFGTVGFSTGVVAHFSTAGQFVIICMMIFGKLGPLTLMFTIATRGNDDIRYPRGKLFIG